MEDACKFDDENQVEFGSTAVCMRKPKKGGGYKYKNKCMKNDKLHEAMFEEDGTDGAYAVVSCGCCTAEMVGSNKLKNDDKEYCVNGPVACTPSGRQNDDDWSPCDISGKGEIKKIDVCVTDLMVGNRERAPKIPKNVILSQKIGS